jgi:hypothetical protein
LNHLRTCLDGRITAKLQRQPVVERLRQ